jgi:predicted DNA-binding transcriptional regulator YafY
VTARELAERFSVSSRTIYRDIDALSLAGIPVYTEKGKGGGISLLPDFVLSKSILSESEQQEVLSALEGLAAVGAAQTVEVVQKLSAVFNKKLTNWIDIDFSDWGVDNSQAFQTLKTAIAERRVVEFDYLGTVGEKIRRRVEPLQLCFKSKAWYLKGFCLLREDSRLFKILRMSELSITDIKCKERGIPDFKLEPHKPYEEEAFIKLVLRIDAKLAFRVYDEFQESQIEPQPDGSFVITMTVPEDSWLYGYVLSYGEHAKVLEPERVGKIIREKAKKIAEL